MARMRPERPDPAIRHTPAEEAIFAALRDETPDSWIALHDVFPWRDRRERVDRPHFVLIGSPGVLCLGRGTGYAFVPNQGWSINGHGTAGGVFRWTAGAEEEVRTVLLDRAPGSAAAALLGWGVLFGPDGRPEGPPFPDEDSYVSHELHRSPESLSAFLDRLVRRGRVGRRISDRGLSPAEQRRIALALDPRIEEPDRS
jgi:hypothetical protein